MPSERSKQIIWLAGVVTGNLVVFWFAVVPLSGVGVPDPSKFPARWLVGPCIFGIVLLLTLVIPVHWKDSLVFFRDKDALPGARIFGKRPLNNRIDWEQLEDHYGRLPEDSRDQNRLWYKIYHKHRDSVGIRQANCLWLVMRDWHWLSIILAVSLGGASFALGGVSVATACYFFGLVLQYCFTMIAAQNAGWRFVTIVLENETAE